VPARIPPCKNPLSPIPSRLLRAQKLILVARAIGPALQYKAGSQLREVNFPGGTKGAFEYQASGLRSKLALSDGGRAEYNYDPAGNLTASKVFDKKGKQINGQKLDMDESYQLTRWTLFDGTVTDFKYDRNGNLTEIKKAS